MTNEIEKEVKLGELISVTGILFSTSLILGFYAFIIIEALF